MAGPQPGVMLLLALCWFASCSCADGAPQQEPPIYNSSDYNRIAEYAARNVSRQLFEQGIDNSGVFIMPLETSLVVSSGNISKPTDACFSATEPRDLNLIRQGKKLPCYWTVNAWGNIDYTEQNAADELLRSNCYSYAIGRSTGSYGDPGLGGTGRALQLPVTSCGPVVAGVQADGGKLVDRATVLGTQPSARSHYIALAIKPPSNGQDTSGDFHFWRRDADGTFSYKAGDTLSRRTFRNGRAITDVEAPEARGAYTEFCGYFQVWPDTHKLRGNGYHYSNLPARFKLWSDLGLQTTVTPLARITPEFIAAYKVYFADSGWEDRGSGSVPAVQDEKGPAGAGGMQLRPPPHWYSVSPLALQPPSVQRVSK